MTRGYTFLMKSQVRPGERKPGTWQISAFPLAALAATAVVIGHQLTYLLSVPSGSARASLLAATGHGYLSTTTHVVCLAGLAAAGGVFLRSLTGSGSEPGRGALFRAASFLAAPR